VTFPHTGPGEALLPEWHRPIGQNERESSLDLNRSPNVPWLERMNMRALVVATAAVAAVGAALAAACSGSDSGERAGGRRFVRSCDSAVAGTLPRDWQRSSAVASPLTLFFFGEVRENGRLSLASPSRFEPVAGSDDRYEPDKVLALVRSGAVVTLEVPEDQRDVSLLYDPQRWGRRSFRVADGDRSVTFHSCKGSDAPTQFNGGFVVAGPRCATLNIVPSSREPTPIVLSFGARRC
jgi:hypothetical protein